MQYLPVIVPGITYYSSQETFSNSSDFITDVLFQLPKVYSINLTFKCSRESSQAQKGQEI
jgi:hypothetical protein